MSRKKLPTDTRAALGFLLPNIIGFLIFSLVPLVFSLVMAFTNWDLGRHNMFKDSEVRFIGLENFVQLFTERNFWRFFGNTLFIMLTIPFQVGGSLLLAVLLTTNLRGDRPRVFGTMLLGVIFVVCTVMLAVLGFARTTMTLVLTGMACGVLVFGTVGGSTFYRTMFYMPHFTAGVATFILWKKLYNPVNGPLNSVLRGPLQSLGEWVTAAPPALPMIAMVVLLVVALVVQGWGLIRLYKQWHDSETGSVSFSIGAVLLFVPAWLVLRYAPVDWVRWVFLAANVVMLLALLPRLLRGRTFPTSLVDGADSALVVGFALLVVAGAAVGLGFTVHNLPTLAADGLAPPDWVADYHWAKPSLMIMMLWGSIGSNFMLLYIAGISNIPLELYEAADIDGVSPLQKFWHVTWPQLAPTTFFIVVMATINGLRGGFEMARTMTEGGPAGATTFLSYYIYTEGFDLGRLGFASAVAWTLFGMTLAVTLFNWKFGSSYVND